MNKVLDVLGTIRKLDRFLKGCIREGYKQYDIECTQKTFSVSVSDS